MYESGKDSSLHCKCQTPVESAVDSGGDDTLGHQSMKRNRYVKNYYPQWKKPHL